MTTRDSTRLRLGALCLVVSGVCSAIGLPLRGPIVLPQEDPQLWAEVASIETHFLAWTLLLPSLVIQCFGFMAVYAAAADSAEDGLAFWGMVFSVAGNALFLPFTGVLAFVDPAVAALYQAGQTHAVAVSAAAIEAPLAGAVLAGSGILLLGGSVLFAVVLWRSPRLPAWTAAPYLYHALALTLLAPLSYTVERSGGLVLLVVSLAIARAVWCLDPAAQAQHPMRHPA